MEILGKSDCCVEIVTELAELPLHPLHSERGVFFEIDGGENVGRVLQVRTPVGQPANPTAPPRLGQHSREVLGEYGFSDAEITGIVGG
jgi:alpha-methylacyl-CoA racemase